MPGNRVNVRLRVKPKPAPTTSTYVPPGTYSYDPPTTTKSNSITIGTIIKAAILSYGSFMLALFMCYPLVIILFVMGLQGSPIVYGVILLQLVIYIPIVFNYLWHWKKK